jgi:2-iminoacetate synthase ThiH
MGVKSIREGITKFVRDALESRDVVQEIKTVEIHIEEFIEYLKNAGLGGFGGRGLLDPNGYEGNWRFDMVL